MSFYFTFEKMSEHYNSLLESGLQSDVVLVAGYKEFRVHKVILSARSPVFAAMFAHSSTKEAQENRVEIVDVDWEVLESFVRYIYTGKVESLDQFAGDLLIAADKYQLASLKSICEKHLPSVEITTENASDLLFLADMYQISELVEKCLDYIVHNGTQVIATEGWERIRVKAHLLEKLFEISSAKFSKVFDRGDRYGKIKKKYIAGQKNKTEPFRMASFESLIFEEMSQNYGSLLKSELLSDAVLLAGGKELKVHKVVLSTRSPVFAEMFTNSSTSEAQENRFEITEMDVEVLERLVQYVYTGNVETPDRNAAVDLFLTAMKYQLECLKTFCERQLSYYITAESICDLLFFADMHSATELFAECLNNFIRFGTKVMASNEDWEKKIVARIDLLAKLYERSSLKYSRLVENVYYREKKVESTKEDEDYNGVDWTVRPDLDFEMDLLKYANFIICKEEMTEVILVVGDAELKVHKQVLSAGSPVFAAIFYSHDPTEKEAKENRLVITDLDMEVLKALIKYIYTGNVEGLDYNAIGKLLVAAHKYQVHCLKSICVQLLSQMTTIESVLNLLILAHTYQITELYSKCLVYITENCAQVVASVGWKKKMVLKADLFANICESLNLNFTEQLLLCSITAETVSNLLILACKHQVTELITKCVDYITANGTEVMQQEGWKKIVVRGDLMVKLLECLTSKYKKVIEDKNEIDRENEYDYENDYIYRDHYIDID